MPRMTMLFATVLVQAAPALAQRDSLPVTIYVMTGGETAGAVAGVQLSITPLDRGSSVLATTDSLGKASRRLAPGRYQIRSLNPVRRGGEVYSWDIEVTVRTSYPALIVTLNRQNAMLGIDDGFLPKRAPAVPAQPIQPRAKVAIRDDSTAFLSFKGGWIYYRNVTRCEAARVPKGADRIYFRAAEDARRLGLIPSKETGCQ